MTDLDLTRYEGHTPGPWNAQDHEDELLIFAPRHGRLGETLATLQVSDLPSSRFQKEQQQANARLIADAPLLLAEVRRLREENEQQRKTIERYAQWDAQRQRNVDLAAQLTALRQSHARLLKEMYFQRERWVLLKQVPDDPGDQAACAIRNLDAAVAEAEGL